LFGVPVEEGGEIYVMGTTFSVLKINGMNE
jgi:hypothetical protein